MKFYPYDLYVLEQSEAEFDKNGFLIPDNIKFSYVCKCRDYAYNQHITNTDTKEISKHISMIMLPLNAPNITLNSLIRVLNGDEIRLEARVVRFERNQLHCRVWV